MIEIQIGKLAEKLSVHRNTVSNWIKSGKLAAQPTIAKRYLIDEAELFRFCDQFSISKEFINEFKKCNYCVASDNSAQKKILGKNQLKQNQFVPEQTEVNTTRNRNEVTMTDKPIGSAMVVGGGIAGMQATLDLAESGYRVYMVEKSTGIGGAMAQLDKTFPTNDCAM